MQRCKHIVFFSHTCVYFTVHKYADHICRHYSSYYTPSTQGIRIRVICICIRMCTADYWITGLCVTAVQSCEPVNVSHWIICTYVVTPISLTPDTCVNHNSDEYFFCALHCFCASIIIPWYKRVRNSHGQFRLFV